MTYREQEQELLNFFHLAHLPDHLQTASRPFHDLAHAIYNTVDDSAELVACLRKLLEAKDCAVRAQLGG